MCCFCGGASRAVEEDHQPGRALFDGRHWPEGFVFPSCSKCNLGTSLNEAIVAALARSGEFDPTKASQLKFEQLMKSIAKRDPEVARDLRPSSAAKKMRLLKEIGYVPPTGETYGDQGLFELGDRIHEAFFEYGRKLALATFYKVTGEILNPGGGTITRYLSNYNAAKSEELFQSEGFGAISQIHESKRNGQDLANQFQLRANQTDCGSAVGFAAILRDNMIIIGAAYEDPQKSSLFEKHKFAAPYAW